MYLLKLEAIEDGAEILYVYCYTSVLLLHIFKAVAHLTLL